MTFRTRFAPSPTGPLHLGHAYSAMLAYEFAQSRAGDFVLRIEDLDRTRCRPEWEASIFEDLSWLGLNWPEPVLRQSERLDAYGEALDRLWQRGLLYPCRCSRRDIAEAASAPQEGAPATGPDGVVYPGTCRAIFDGPGTRSRPTGVALRLDMSAAAKDCALVRFTETGASEDGTTGEVSVAVADLIKTTGDFVVSRRDMESSYHLAVTVDDAAQDITHVVRGRDLFDATPLHVLLQRLLGLPTPVYHHHRLIRDEAGKRLAKRDDARAISLFRREGASPADIRRMVGL